MRTEDDPPIQITARVMPPDIIIADIRPLTARQTSEFEQWEIYHD
ncbi:hypothetical protein ACWDUL_26955 [Nocardia niigatensis]